MVQQKESTLTSSAKILEMPSNDDDIYDSDTESVLSDLQPASKSSLFKHAEVRKSPESGWVKTLIKPLQMPSSIKVEITKEVTSHRIVKNRVVEVGTKITKCML